MKCIVCSAILWDKRCRRRRMGSIQLRGSRTETVFMGSDSMLWAEEGTGSRASWVQRGEGPSCSSSGWPWVQAYTSIAKESLHCCKKHMWSPWKTFCVFPCGRRAIEVSPRGQAVETTQLEGSCGNAQPRPLRGDSPVTGYFQRQTSCKSCNTSGKHTEQILTLLFNRIKYCYLIDVENEVQELTWFAQIYVASES